MNSEDIHTSVPDPNKAIDRSIPDFPVAKEVDDNDYFTKNTPPTYIHEVVSKVKDFLQYHKANTFKKIALITSGGTTVPLENNTVRFIDNFSAGTRGSTSAEILLKNGYAVIFLYREFSLLPYSRHFSHNLHFLDYMKINSIDNKIEINDDHNDKMYKILLDYQKIKDSNSLLIIPFTTVNQYLFTLKSISTTLNTYGSKSLIYLAAAVSDFFIPVSKLPQHKIQSSVNNLSSNGQLIINLDPVPKFLKRIVDDWSNNSLIISFKLETDQNILINKAKLALKRYNHNLVIGNLLQTRKKEVVFVSKSSNESNQIDKNAQEKWFRLTDDQIKNNFEIEEIFLPEVIKLHDLWINKTN
ncbi:phosphopantothenate--cysteine ligase CAB2 [Ascoidea rubescens DSM 1968]|uniref:DFP-domain-containing protein n=1 Tax=Ascoidea rubescens DSM 1968 TaxID=1344418 RepID=A0A1D2VED0_9ASCO|nr:DFP-domain-containing protein [Ascoidea rubescens DSM 1968]ODV60058.1 DFP-domain-containing protein [Ascoidea rubescens DSM 1968]